jgi:hypothetical protein
VGDVVFWIYVGLLVGCFLVDGYVGSDVLLY